MDQCPRCGKWLVEYDFQWSRKKCYSNDCDYREWYCPEKWLLEHDYLPRLLGKKNDIKGKCREWNYPKFPNYMQGSPIARCLDCECMPKDQKTKIIKAIVAEEL